MSSPYLFPVGPPRRGTHQDLSIGWQVSWRAVSWGLGLQFILGLFVIRTEPGFTAFQWLGDQIQVCTWGHTAQGILGCQGLEERALGLGGGG